MRSLHVILILLFFCSGNGFSQSDGSSWNRAEPVQRDLYLFHSPHGAVLPTAEMLQKGDWEFEVSHRFNTPVSEGPQTFWGMDGPAVIRLALGYAVSNKTLVTIGRTNIQDNLELQTKVQFLQIPHQSFPMLFAARGGIAYNGEIYDPIKNESRRYQGYVQAIWNTLIRKKVGIGIVPTYLINSHIFCVDVQNSLTLGVMAQYYVSPRWSFFAEWNPTVTGWRQDYDSFTLGFEVETGGHFFKIVATNNDYLNTTQYSAGANHAIGFEQLRIGFMITRLIKL